MPTVEEIFEDPTESWESRMTTMRMILANAEQASDKTLDSRTRRSDRSDGMSMVQTRFELGIDLYDHSPWTSGIHPSQLQHLTASFRGLCKEFHIPQVIHESVPSAFHDFEDVFSKVSL